MAAHRSTVRRQKSSSPQADSAPAAALPASEAAPPPAGASHSITGYTLSHQPGLSVGEPGDGHEQEAEAVARAVVGAAGAAPAPAIQRAGAGLPTLPRGAESAITAARGGGSPLPSDTRAQLEPRFGASFAQVRVHADQRADRLSQGLQARAFTVGNDIFFRRGAYDPAGQSGRHLLAHELTHTLQQRGGTAVQRFTAPADLKQAAQSHTKALARHQKDRALLKSYVQQGKKSSDRRLKNSCEWILDGRTKLYALTPTGDSTERLTHHGKDPSKDEAFFPQGNGGAGDLNSPIADYNHGDLDDNTNVVLDSDGKVTGGWNNPGYIAIMVQMGGKTRAKKDIWSVLKHEVQHDSDKNQDKRAAATALAGDAQPDATQVAQSLERYKTEYRAYNYEGGPFSKLSATKKVNRYGYTWTQRQLAIFEHIWSGYDYTKEVWDDSYMTGTWTTANPGKALPPRPSSKGSPYEATIAAGWQDAIKVRQQAIVDYVNPDTEGFNKYNSIRVDDFYKALNAVPKNTADENEKTVKTLTWKTAFLGKADAKYVLKESPDMRKKMREHLIDKAYVKILTILQELAK